MLQEESGALNQLLAKRAALEQKRADLEKKIRDLGALPTEAFELQGRKGLKELQRDLTRTQNELKKFT